VAFELIPRLAKKPELSASQAGGILKYRRLALLDSYVFWLIKARRPPRSLGMDLKKNRIGSRVGFRRSARPAETLGEFRYLRSLERKIYGYSLWFAINDTKHAIKIGI